MKHVIVVDTRDGYGYRYLSKNSQWITFSIQNAFTGNYFECIDAIEKFPKRGYTMKIKPLKHM